MQTRSPLRRYGPPAVALLALAALLIWAFRPTPEPVDTTRPTRGAMEVTVEAEGMTRVRDPYLVTAPITGTVLRAPLAVGDAVTMGQSVVAEIRPAEPAFLDARARAQAEAAVTEAEASVRLAEAQIAKAEADLAYARSEYERNRELAARGIVPPRTLEAAGQARDSAEAALAAARSEADLNRATLARAQASLVAPTDPSAPATGSCCIAITAPASGTVLTIADTSARLVQAGEELMTIGDLGDLEIETDLLSSDAVQVAPGARAHIERWGGPGVLEATVRRIEPAAFTRTSALGIEEQRVHLRLDFTSPPEARAGLGERFRVYTRIVTWAGENVLTVPQSALFRQGEGWAVFRIVSGRAVATPVEIGHSNARLAEVISGISEGDLLVAWPGSRVSDGTRVTPR
ncbi:MAG: efflux RND transporter periplasmic adaptor subunit [Paenirhodobacter sp.]|uniref:efflux RND transporter periplasmic adaptor subunit n=1 Tax=Paenirhodobacter sp. TaxID=1965326 RepID=UPI003D11D26F